MVLNGVGLRMVGVMVLAGGRGREGLGERKGGILGSVYILGVAVHMIDVVCIPDRRSPSGRAGGGPARAAGSYEPFLAPATLRP